MGLHGPIPKRSSNRAGARAQADEPDHVALPNKVQAPPIDPKWGTAARSYYRSLTDSGQATYFEPTDWQQAAIICTLLTGQLKDSTLHTRLLKETRALVRLLTRFLGTQDDEDRLIILNDVRSIGNLINRLGSGPNAAMMKEIFKAMSDLGTTEGARRRMKIEVERSDVDDDGDGAEIKGLTLVAGGRG